jgi:translocation and assembly module TamB
VLGTALAPRITLVSQPAVPDTEKLSWLVLGQGLSNASQGDANALQAAAGALLAEGTKAGVQGKLASAFGLDTVSFGTSQDSLQHHIVTVGKRISSNLYVTYQQALDSASSAISLFYTVSFD